MGSRKRNEDRGNEKRSRCENAVHVAQGYRIKSHERVVVETLDQIIRKVR